ncbi:hypothetical protein GV829_00430 [Sphingomonas lacunae]|uniref:Uncharacterized protein n=1 Tax=Sphingomonas lacunae TaxID=2698828 RepID=A0A6M4APX4_9SPHN|nr:hypothetical protein [Sphingomonas lacunae]QJQ31105.1 hypothetical protein GV829_00430 [Sphingomonas lacunae]
MLTGGDDFPIHQTPEPVALVTDRNFYDRYFFNGYSPDGNIFFAAAMGIYPALDVIDGAFCVMVNGVQHNLRASARMHGERMALQAGPIRVTIEQPLHRVRITVTANDGPLSCDLTITGRHFPIEEPRFTRRNGTRLFMDYTRMTQNGRWSGHIMVDGQRIEVDSSFAGTRDRSWGIRPVGLSDPQPPPSAISGSMPQFFWLWSPCNFDQQSLFFHTNDDGEGQPWNRRGVLFPDGGNELHFDQSTLAIDWNPATRRVREARVELGPDTVVRMTPISGGGSNARGHFYMSGLGYTHPVWGHGMDHGELDVGHDSIDLTSINDNDPALMHIQAMCDVVLTHAGQEIRGRGVVEQLFIGPHAPSGLHGLFDPA